jgi:hypothetical protein
MVKQWSPCLMLFFQAWIGAQSICGQFCWFMLWLLGISEKNVSALEQMTHKPVCWFRYVDDIFVIWPHGKETLTISEPPHWTPQQDTVHNGRSNKPPSILAHWHLQKNGQLLRPQSLLEAHPYQSPPKRSPGFFDTQNQKLSVTRIPSPKNWYFDHCFQWYTLQEIWWSLKTASQTAKTNDKPTLTAFIPYTQTMYGWLSRMLAKHIIRSVSDCILPL